MDVHLLGPVDVVTDRGAVALGGPKQRALLAMLALEPGSVVSTEQLIDGLWGDDPPASAAKLVQQYVSHVRRALAAGGEDGAIATRGRGYELCVGRDSVDATRCERLLAQGAPREALALWRGAPLSDVAQEPFAAHQTQRLEELHTAAVEMAIEQDLDAGRHLEVLPELEGLLAKEPLRERLHAQRMLALYRCGRQADALEAYREARRLLVGEIGVEPGPELHRLHAAILRHDPALESPAERERHATPLLGREAELEQLRGAWRRARETGHASVVVVGGPGLGKTRLAQELADEVRLDADVVWIPGGDADATAAISAAIQAQRPALVVIDDADRADPGAWRNGSGGGGVLVLATAEEAATVVAEETLALRPLGSDAAAALARFHAGARDGEEPPTERIVADAGGIPARVQEAAMEWARAQALRRLADAAARAAAERAQWRLAEDDVATEMVDVQVLRDRSAGAGPKEACPFQGLASFGIDDASRFFGRERLVGDLVAAIPGARLLGIVGPSGSGKSSAMRAGLLASLRDGVLPGSDDWPQAVLRPGAHPLRALERARRVRPARGRWVLAVDQFEELFVACGDEEERVAFVDALIEATRDATSQALVIIAVRADFYGRCAAYPQLSRPLRGSHVLVGPMRRHELQRAIEMPALRAGAAVEPDLVETLAADVEGAPGALPLLSTTLWELWHQPGGADLSVEAYERAGGVRGAVARLAETVFEAMSASQRDQARRVLLRLAGDGDLRVRVPRSELSEDDAVVSLLAAQRLLTIGDDGVEVAHEALLREWPRLRGWLEEDAEGRRLHRHLAQAAREWDAGGREPSELYRGPRLAAVLEWRDAHEADLNALEREFADASRAAAEADVARQRRANLRLRALLGVVATLLLAAVAAGVVALTQRGEARDAALTADAQRVGAEALVEERLDLALLLGRAGFDLERSTATESRLLSVLLRQPAALGELHGDGWPLYSVGVSADGRLLAIGDERGAVIVYDAITRRRIGPARFLSEAVIQQVLFTPDGRSLAVAWYDEARELTLVDVIDPRTGARQRQFELPRLPGGTFYGTVLAAFEPDGRHLITQQSPVEGPDGPPSILWRLDLETGAKVRAPEPIGTAGARNLSMTADGERVFVTSGADDRTYEIEADSLRIRRSYPAGGPWGAVDPQGRTFAFGRAGGTVGLLDLRSGRARTFDETHETTDDLGFAFAPDGKTFVTSADAGDIFVWDVASGAVRERFTAHTDAIPQLAIASDGRTLLSAAGDAKLMIWDLAGDRRLDERFDGGPPMVNEENQSPRGLALTADGSTLAVGQLDGTVELIDTATLRRRARLRVLDGEVLGLAFSPDGGTLAATGAGGSAVLWSVDERRRIRVLREAERKVSAQAVAFSPDGRLVAAGVYIDDKSGRVDVWDAGTGRLQDLRMDLPAVSLAFSPDGRLLAGAGMAAGTQVSDVRTGDVVANPKLSDFSRTVAFSPDGRTLAVGEFGGGVVTLSTRSWEPTGRDLENHRSRVTALDFSSDGRRLLTGDGEGDLLLSDLATRRPIGTALTVGPEAYVAAEFAVGGAHVFAVPHTGRAVRWDVRPAAWARHACLVAGRKMTRREWNDVLPARPFTPVCD